jgi:predicted phage terminase large subunit-like protein
MNTTKTSQTEQPPSTVGQDEIVIRAQPGPQALLLQCPAFEIFLGGARGGGKSWGIILDWIAHEARYGRNARGIVFRRKLTEFTELQDIAKKTLGEVGWVYKEQKATWVAPSGATLLFRYVEHDNDVDVYKGWSVNWLSIDEVADWPHPEPVDKLRAIIRSGIPGMRTRMLLTGNPGGRGHEWCKERYISIAPPMTIFTNSFGLTQCFIPSTIRDNPALLENNPTYINQLRASGPSWLVQAWLEGNWDIVMEGKLFKRDMLVHDDLPEIISDQLALGKKAIELFDFVVIAWDTAVKEKEQNDFSACTVWGKLGSKFYLLDAWRGKYPFGQIKMMIGQMYQKWGAHRILIEDKASGSSLLQELRREPVCPVEILVPTSPMSRGGNDKFARAGTVIPVWESHRVILPKEATWLIPYVNELLSFQPDCAHDDWVDSTVYALDYLLHKVLYEDQDASRQAQPIVIYRR